MVDEDRSTSLRFRGCDAGWSLGTAQRIHRHVVQVVAGVVLDPVLASLRAFPALLPGEHAPLFLRWKGADQYWSDLDSAHRAAPDLQHPRVHSDGGGDVLP